MQGHAEPEDPPCRHPLFAWCMPTVQPLQLANSDRCPALWLQEVLQLGPTMYFGELALLKNEPRAATVRARTNVSVLSLSQSHFTAIVGQIQGKLLQHADAYQPLSMPGKQVSAAALLSEDVQAQLPACLPTASRCRLHPQQPQLPPD